MKDLWYIVNSVKQDLGIDSNNHDLRFLKWTIDGYKDLALANVMRSAIKTARLPVIVDEMSGQRKVNLPDDYVDYYKIAICYRGYIINLDANDNICIAPPKLNCCGQEMVDAIDSQVDSWTSADDFAMFQNSNYYWDYFPYWKNGQFVAGMYGRGEGGYRAGYKIDFENRQIVFDQYLKATEIILEYKTQGIDDKGNAIVPEGCEGALIAFVHWKRSMFSKDQQEHRDYAEWRKRYQREVKRLNARIMAMSVVEILDIYRNSIHQGPKR